MAETALGAFPGLFRACPFRREGLLLIADAILGKISDDTSRNDCNLVSGLSLSSVQITPEASLFGGWSGWSVELSFE